MRGLSELQFTWKIFERAAVFLYDGVRDEYNENPITCGWSF